MEYIEGKYVSSGNGRLYLKKTGEGAPSVVIEPAWGSLSAEWFPIQQELSNETTVIAYDRAGYAESPKGGMPRTAMEVADELFNMLTNAGESGPVVLAGHAGGGLYCQMFARMFPRMVAGMVLVDSLTVNDMEFDRLDAPKYHEMMSVDTRLKNMREIAALEKEEFVKNIVPLVRNLYSEMHEDLRHQMTEYQSDQQFYKTVVDEFESREDSIEQLLRIGEFPDIPLKVLTRDFNVMIGLAKQIGVPEEEARMAEELWMRNSKSLCDLTTDSELIIVRDASHNIHIERPDVIKQAIRDVIAKVQ
ncbi:MAG: alpha/beta fold hydrolase [Candidatus Kapaibacterium sp.]